MALRLAATDEVKQTLRTLKADETTRPAYDAIAARITALRTDPGDPRLRGKVYRVVDGLTVRVPLIEVQELREQWALAWTVTEQDGVATLRIERLDKVI